MERVLLIGNDEATRELSFTLQDAGFTVTQIPGGAAGWPGLSHFRNESPDVILLAEDTTVVDGVELLPGLRHITAAPILVTGTGREEAAINALLSGADAYLPNSVSGETILAYIKALLRRRVFSSEMA
jgi:DNA-binding response OmpR family regulator